MKRSALVLLLLGSANTACFRPTLECARCDPSKTCPSGLACNAGFCTTTGGLCTSAPDGTDGSVEHDAKTSICVGASCLDVPPGLVVWADRTSLPPGGQPITSWIDRSGNSHPVTPVNPAAPPSVQLDQVGRLADIDNAQTVLSVQDGAALNFGKSDFAIMVLALCGSDGFLGCVFDDTTTRNRLGLKLYCNVQGEPSVPGATAPDRAQLQLIDGTSQQALSVIVSTREDTPDAMHLYVARRTGDVLQLRMDGQIQGQTAISSNFDDSAPLLVGACTTETNTTPFRGKLGAVIVIEAALDDGSLSALENFVLSTMGPGAPPLPL